MRKKGRFWIIFGQTSDKFWFSSDKFRQICQK